MQCNDNGTTDSASLHTFIVGRESRHTHSNSGTNPERDSIPAFQSIYWKNAFSQATIRRRFRNHIQTLSRLRIGIRPSVLWSTAWRCLPRPDLRTEILRYMANWHQKFTHNHQRLPDIRAWDTMKNDTLAHDFIPRNEHKMLLQSTCLCGARYCVTCS